MSADSGRFRDHSLVPELAQGAAEARRSSLSTSHQQPTACRLVEPKVGSVTSDDRSTALRFVLEMTFGENAYLITCSYAEDETCQRALRRDAGRFRAISVPYRLTVQRDAQPSVLAGSLKLTFDGHGHLTRVVVRRMKEPFSFLQAPIRQWLSRFMHQEFTRYNLATIARQSQR